VVPLEPADAGDVHSDVAALSGVAGAVTLAVTLTVEMLSVVLLNV
jgi:hypothetical protein